MLIRLLLILITLDSFVDFILFKDIVCKIDDIRREMNYDNNLKFFGIIISNICSGISRQSNFDEDRLLEKLVILRILQMYSAKTILQLNLQHYS